MFSFYLKPLKVGADRVKHRRTNEHDWDGVLRFISHVSLIGRKLPLNVVITSDRFPAGSVRMRVGTKQSHTHNSRQDINEVFENVILKYSKITIIQL